jgi:hypothetical protein
MIVQISKLFKAVFVVPWTDIFFQPPPIPPPHMLPWSLVLSLETILGRYG